MPGGNGVDLGIEGFEDAVEIGRGGFAVVYRARQPALNRQVAVKMLAPAATAGPGGTTQDRFEREGWAMGTLSGHPNIVNVIATGQTAAGQPYIVMTYLAQGSLADRVDREGPLPWTEVVRVGIKLAGALEMAHRAGTLHRDVKPENVLLSDYGEPQLTDFGIARVEGRFTGATATGHITASVAHAAPEILDGRSATVASDVYSLGSTLFALLAGRPPFARRDGEELVAQFLRISRDPVPDLRPLGVPDAVCRAVETAMDKDPARRQPSAAELGRQLQESQRRAGLPVTEMALVLPEGATRPAAPDQPARPLLPPASGDVTEAPELSEPAPPAGPAGARRSRLPLAIAVASVALAVVVVAIAARGIDSRREVAAGGQTTTTGPPSTVPTVEVGSGPTAVVNNSANQRLYVANSDSRSVSVLDAVTNDTVTTINLSSRPTGIAVNPRSNRLYVTNAEAVLTIIDTVSNEVVGSVELSSRANGITVNHRTDRVYVTGTEPVVWVVDGRANAIVATVPLPSVPYGVAVHPEGNRIYVTGRDAGALWVLDGATNQVVATVEVGPAPCGVAVSPRTNRVFVTSLEAGRLHVLDAETNQVVGSVEVTARPCGVSVNPEANRIYVTSQESGLLSVVDGSTTEKVADERLFPPDPSGPALLADVNADPNEHRVYVVSRATGHMAVLSER
jgi:YVTN family beta-propeller protein